MLLVRPLLLSFFLYQLHHQLQCLNRFLIRKPGIGGAASAVGRELRQFLAEQGPTPGCRACDEPGHRAHIPICKARRAVWLQQQQQQSSSSGSGAVGSAPDVRMELGQDEREQATPEEAKRRRFRQPEVQSL